MTDKLRAVASDLTIVVRSAHERTEAICQTALRAQTDAAIHVIHERPFSAALRKGLEIGIAAGRELTLCVDADIIAAPGAITRMIRRLEASPKAFVVAASFLDKFYGRPKPRGAHLYRTSVLAEAIQVIPTSGRTERPETAMKQVMGGRGWQVAYVEDHVLGLHGYEQSYRDIFRTIACRGQKSRDEFPALMERFSRHAHRDADLRVALWALVAGLEGDYSLDAAHWEARVTDLLDAAQLSEKPALDGRRARRALALAALAGRTPMSFWRRLRKARETLALDRLPLL